MQRLKEVCRHEDRDKMIGNQVWEIHTSNPQQIILNF
jgi:hypothetical protein